MSVRSGIREKSIENQSLEMSKTCESITELNQSLGRNSNLRPATKKEFAKDDQEYFLTE